MPLPNFIIAGSQKSGSTSLHYSLLSHPDVFMPVGKRNVQDQETHFFDDDENYAKGVEWYLAQFEGYNNQKLTGETTPLYLYFDYVPSRIKELVPDAKLIFILRNPVDRTFSQYWHVWRKGREKYSFEKSLTLEDQRIKKNYWHKKNFSYVSASMYYKQLLKYLEFFPKEQIHLVLFENLKKDKLGEINKCFRFLGLDELTELPPDVNYNKTFIPKNRLVHRILMGRKFKPAVIDTLLKKINSKFNIRDKYPVMKPATKQKLQKIFEPDMQLLEQEFNISLDVWRK